MKELLFVYGTLRKGERAFRMMEGSTSLGEGTIQGAIYHLGAFPGLKLTGDSVVVGELYEVEGLHKFDHYEGYPIMYERKKVPVQVKGLADPVEAWVYTFNYPVKEDCKILS